jgi:hypothetical protein
METNTEVLEKIKKLLRLAASDNPNEAALAAAKAQELMDRHKLNQAMLATPSEPEEGVVHFDDPDDALDTFGGKRVTWKDSLSAGLAKYNGCFIYVDNRTRGEIRLVIVGRPSDVQTVRYLYAFCVREIERLTRAQGPGHGRTWTNNYRRGCVASIYEALHEQRKSFEGQARTEAAHSGSSALVKVNTALAKIDSRYKEAEESLKKVMKLRAGKESQARHDSGAYERGKRDGATINLGAGKGLGAGAGARRQLGGG